MNSITGVGLFLFSFNCLPFDMETAAGVGRLSTKTSRYTGLTGAYNVTQPQSLEKAGWDGLEMGMNEWALMGKQKNFNIFFSP
jgi:hypothetical protein